MKNKKIKVSIIFVVIFLTTFIPPLFPTIFGDWVCEGRRFNPNEGVFGTYTGCDHYGATHNSTTHYGFRHWLLILFGLAMTTWNLIDIFSKED